MSSQTIEDRVTSLENEVRFLSNQGANNTSRSQDLSSQLYVMRHELSNVMNFITFLHDEISVMKSSVNPGEQ